MPDLKAFLSPNAVAVIGASDNADILRGRIMKVMMGHDFKGEIYPISRSSDEVFGLKAYPTIGDVPGHVDLAILIIPAEFVPDTLRECGRKGVKAAQIITSGFAEEVGQIRPQAAVEVVRRSDYTTGFKVLPRRWLVERTIGWLMLQRRLVRDYEQTESSAEAFIYLAMIRIQLRRLA